MIHAGGDLPVCRLVPGLTDAPEAIIAKTSEVSVDLDLTTPVRSAQHQGVRHVPKPVESARKIINAGDYVVVAARPLASRIARRPRVWVPLHE